MRSLIVVVLALFAALPVTAQYVEDAPAVDSAYWWTLTDQITPEQLYAELQSRERSQDRLRKAIELGRYDVLQEERIQEVSLFIDGSSTPELFPVWEVFHAYSYNFDGLRRDYEQTARRQLADAGISPAGIAKIISLADRNWRREEAANVKLHPRRMKFVREVLAPTQEALGKKLGHRVVMDTDFSQLSRLSGLGRESVTELYEAWHRDVASEVAVESVKELRSDLRDEDWEGLRRFLLTRVASNRKIDYFSERPLR